MPELPEVETLVRGLRATLLGRRILAVHLGKTDFIDDAAALERELPGQTISAVTRHRKFFVLVLGSGLHHLFVHLGMTGHLAAHDARQPEAKHTHVIMPLDDGRELRYTDPRRFGRMAVLTAGQLAERLRQAGAEPLTVSPAEFRARLAGHRGHIKSLLLNQRVLGGLGNIYADESLWYARIHPLARPACLSAVQLEKLRRAVQRVLAAAIRAGGSSISDYRDAEGNPGWFQTCLRAYGRTGKPCRRCGTAIRRIVIAGRSSHFCPQCQRRGPAKNGIQRRD